jgi:CheY-like chemotaxis protein
MSKRILVVEDQSDNRQIIRDMAGPHRLRSPRPRTAKRRLQLWQNSDPILS